jgi:8-oxo-dGTP pyrophosphatase MutT (NUDIX family)
MHRNSLIELLRTYRNRWQDERAVVDRYMQFVESNADCFERTLSSGHVTGSAWVVNGPGTHVLLTHHRKLDKWLQLGGHADGDSHVLNVALREAEEESGLVCSPLATHIFDVDIHRIPARAHEPEHFHYDCRFALQSHSEGFTVSDESHDLAWVRITEIADYSQESSMVRMAEKWVQRGNSLR